MVHGIWGCGISIDWHEWDQQMRTCMDTVLAINPQITAKILYPASTACGHKPHSGSSGGKPGSGLPPKDGIVFKRTMLASSV